MNPEFPTPQTTVSGINFATISQEINHQLIARQEAIRNFSQKEWFSLAHTLENTDSSQIGASVTRIDDRELSRQQVEPINGLGKVKKVLNYRKKNELFLNRFATILLVQSKLLPPSVLGVKDLENKI